MASRIMTLLLTICLSLFVASCGTGDDRDPASAGAEPSADADQGQDLADEEDEETQETFACVRSRGKVGATIKAVDNPDGVEFDWKPGRIGIEAGKEVVLTVVNQSYAVHDFSAGQCYSGRIDSKKAIKLAFVMPDEPVPFYCGLHPQGMVGKLVPR